MVVNLQELLAGIDVDKLTARARQLVHRYRLTRESADGLVNDVLIHLAERIDAGKPPNDLMAWMLDQLSWTAKKATRVKEVPLEESQIPSSLDDPIVALDELELARQLLRKAVLELDPELRDVLARSLRGLNSIAIAEELHTQSPTIRKRLQRIRKHLRDSLQESNQLAPEVIKRLSSYLHLLLSQV